MCKYVLILVITIHGNYDLQILITVDCHFSNVLSIYDNESMNRKID